MYGLMGERNPDPMRMTDYIKRKLIRKSVWTLQFIYCSLHFCLPIVNDNAMNVHCAHQCVCIEFSSLNLGIQILNFLSFLCESVITWINKFCTTWLKCLLRFYVTFPKIKITYLYYVENINILLATHWIY